jgi:hypothetical protein
MHRAGLKRLALVTLIASLALAWAAPVAAQEPALDQQQRASLAAIPLITGDLPDGYLISAEGFLSAAGAASSLNLDPAALTDAGFQGMYLSIYQRADTGDTITSTVSAWTDAAAAEQGFALLEDESVTAPGADVTDSALAAGTGSAELTTGTVEVDGATHAVSDATFVVDRYVVGVSVETAPDATMDDAGMQALVDALESRANAVVQGQSPEGTDLALPPTVLDIRPLGVEAQAGFLSAGETERLYGVSGSSLSGITASWVSGVVAGENGAGPSIVIAASTFGDVDTAGRAVEQSADLAPVTLELTPVDFAVDGADAAKGYQYASPGSADGTVDSFRGVIQVGSTMVVVDVQGAASVDTAQAAVSDLLAAQVACGGGTCQLPDINLGS